MEVPSRYEQKTERRRTCLISGIYFWKISNSPRWPLDCTGEAALLVNFPEAEQPMHFIHIPFRYEKNTESVLDALMAVIYSTNTSNSPAYT
jgi:hypothetical protein